MLASKQLDRDDPVKARIARFVNVAHTTGANRHNNVSKGPSLSPAEKCKRVIKSSLADEESGYCVSAVPNASLVVSFKFVDVAPSATVTGVPTLRMISGGSIPGMSIATT